MKKMLLSGIVAFCLLCLIALYQSGYLTLNLDEAVVQPLESREEGRTSANLAALNTDLVDQIAVSALTRQIGSTETFGRLATSSDIQFVLPLEFAGAGTLSKGRVVPQVEAMLSVLSDGVVANLYVNEGEQVTPGQILMVLDDSQERAIYAESQANLSQAVAELEKVKSPSRQEEIAAAQAALDSAKANLQRLEQGTLPGRLAIAEAELAAAAAGREQLESGPRPAEIQAAGAELEGAELFLKEAQRAFDQVSWRNDVGLLPESANLQRATVQYNAALARYQAVFAVATEAEIKGADATVQRYAAELGMIQSSMPSDREALQAEVRFFESRLALLQADPLAADLRVAEARIESAKARVDRAEAELANTVLRAPFAGTIAMIDMNIGERVQEGEPVIRIANLASWQIETEDLTELDVANIEIGASAEIRFDSIPELVLIGKVKNVRPYGDEQTVDTLYKAIIIPETMDQRLRWNMTSYITFGSVLEVP